MINGFINVYKEPGYTSHDVVAKLRGIVHQKKIGHTGTLDPAAEGVLPVCLGKATRAADFLTDETKTYETVMLLGLDTDTQDTTGDVLRQAEVMCSEEEVFAAIRSFEGDQMQVPPMYSARKINGKKLYQYARAGIEVERKTRRVEISDIEILKVNAPHVRFRVSCTKGTYIRTLCRDIGERLGCGACMESLTRTRVGDFTADTALRIAEIETLEEEGAIDQKLLIKAPSTFWTVGLVQFFSWAAFLYMWTYTNGAIAQNVWNTTDTASEAYQAAGNWVGVLFAVQAVGSLAWAAVLPRFKNLKLSYVVSLLVGAAGFASVMFIHNQYALFVSYFLIGFAWAAMLALPFTLLTNALEGSPYMGSYLGLFNCTICLPQIVAAATGGAVLSLLGGSQPAMLLAAGVFLVLGAVSVKLINTK